jgi:Kef-type K+ transport system membrane component KefB
MKENHIKFTYCICQSQEKKIMKGHPVLWIVLAGVLAPMLSKITKRFKAPVVVIEVILGIVIGLHVLGFIQFNDFLSIMFTFGMAATLFMGGMELEFNKNSVRPLSLAAQGWGISLLLAILAVLLLHFIPDVHAPMIVVLALCTTGLGVLIPILRDGGELKTSYGHFITAAGTVGEVGPIVGMSLILAKQFSTWQEIGFLFAFIAIVGMAIVIGASAKPPRFMLYLSREMTSSSQLPVRISSVKSRSGLLIRRR